MTAHNSKDPESETQMKTCFASPRRALPDELNADIRQATASEDLNAMLETVDSLALVINKHRQIIAANTAVKDFLGIEDMKDLLGKRPGEAVSCAYAGDNDAGCGTGRYCSTCGAVLSIVEAQSTNQPSEKKCALRILQGGEEVDMSLRVKAVPAPFLGAEHLILYINDITERERKLEMERMFFHDVLNTVNGLVGSCTLLTEFDNEPEETRALAKLAQNLSRQLEKEIRVQRALSNTDSEMPALETSTMGIRAFVREVLSLFGSHSAAFDKRIECGELPENVEVLTDPVLLYRVVSNMLINACEATAIGDTVKIWAEAGNGKAIIKVWNQSVIPEAVAIRLFHRFFSTKNSPGRGLGTYSMKLIGEKYLGGVVDFITNDEDGTTFSIELPLAP